MTQDKALEILKSGKNVFLTGEPGSGKTYTINCFTEWLREVGKQYAVTASTGIAATHINGVTIHSFSGIGIKENLSQSQIDLIVEKPFIQKNVGRIDVLIIDEVSMLQAQTLDDVNNVMKAIRQEFMDEAGPFGGVQIVFVGDFFQLPPVTKTGKVRFAYESDAWIEANPTVCYLTEQHRQQDAEYTAILNAMRNGEIEESHVEMLKQHSQKELTLPQLFTHNFDVDRLNEANLRDIEEHQYEYEMETEGINFLIQKLVDSCLSPYLLKLKVGAPIMLTKNKFVDEEAVYVNGSLGTVVRLSDNVIEVELATGGTVFLEKEVWEIEDGGHVKARIKQYPLRLAWAITVHKSQGMSFDRASIDLSKTFEFGQGYVALSRVRTLEGLHLLGINKTAFKMHPRIIKQDKVFRELSDKNN